MVNHQILKGKGWNPMVSHQFPIGKGGKSTGKACLLYTSDAADE